MCRLALSATGYAVIVSILIEPITKFDEGSQNLFFDGVEMHHAPLRDRMKLMSAMDRVNEQYGKGMLQLATASLAPAAKP